MAKAHGAALIALTIDEVGMAKTRDRKLEIAQRIKELVCDEHGMDPEALIFDALTFTLTTGDDEWKPSAVETIEGIRLIKSELPGVKTSLGVSNVSFGIGVPARSVLNSVFLHHCVEAGLDLAMVNPNHITPYGEIPEDERKLADDLVFNRSDEALQHFIEHFESKSGEEEAEVADPTADMTPQEALHWHILRRKREGVEAQIDASVDDIGAVPTLNDVLLPAMKEVGDKFGAGELILPFVLQSAEVMKRAVAQLEQYLEKMEGYTKGTVVLATVFGDVHDIGKSLVNTILTNNGYTVIDLGKQVPIGTILDAAEEHKATAIGLSALLVSTSKQMPLAVAELHERGLDFPVLIGGAAINRKFGLRANYPKGKDADDVYEPGVFYCKDAFEGLGVMDKIVDADARAELVTKTREAASTLRETGEEEEVLDTSTTPCAPRPASTSPSPRRRSGACASSRSTSTRSTRTSTPTSCSSSTGAAAASRARSGRSSSARTSARASSACGAIRPTCTRARCSATSPATPRATRSSSSTPRTARPSSSASYTPRQPKADRIALADFFRPKDADELDVIALQAVTAGDEVTELMAKLEQDGEFAEQLFTHGIGVQTAEGMAEWLHWKIREDLGIPATQGRRYSWGYPAVPEQSEHDKVDRLLGLSNIGIRLSGGHAVEPEQSTLALIAHHPQAGYFGMRNGRLLPEGSPDDVIKGTDRDPSLFGVTA